MFNQNLKYRLISRLSALKLSHLTVPLCFILMLAAVLYSASAAAQFYLLALSLFTASRLQIARRVAEDGIWRFKVLLTIVAFFNLWQGNPAFEQLAEILKLINTLVISVLANYLTDFPKLLKTLDTGCNRLYPVRLRAAVRKIIYTLLLAVRYVPELWQSAEKLAQIKKMRGWQPQGKTLLIRMKETAGLIIPLLILTGKKAVELETVFYLKGMRFDAKRTNWQSTKLQTRDWLIVGGCLLLTVPVVILEYLHV